MGRRWMACGMVALVGCTVDGTGIGKLDPADATATDTGGAGTGGTGGNGGSGGIDASAPFDVDPADAALPDVPGEPFANGWPCTVPEDCTSGSCADDVCCESS